MGKIKRTSDDEMDIQQQHPLPRKAKHNTNNNKESLKIPKKAVARISKQSSSGKRVKLIKTLHSSNLNRKLKSKSLTNRAIRAASKIVNSPEKHERSLEEKQQIFNKIVAGLKGSKKGGSKRQRKRQRQLAKKVIF